MGGGASALVFDLSTHQMLLEVCPYALRPPASLEKLYTSVAVLKRLGPGATFLTRVLGTGGLEANGTWRGNLYLRGGGDPTFGDQTFNRDWEDGYGPTATDLAVQLATRGIRRVKGSVIGDASLFDDRPGPPSSDYAPDIPDLGGQLGGSPTTTGRPPGPCLPVPSQLENSPGPCATRESKR